MMTLDVYFFAVFGAVAVLGASLVLLVRRQRRASAEQSAEQSKDTQTVAVKSKQRDVAQAEFAVAAEQAMLDLKTSIEALATCMANLELRMRSVDQRQHKMDDLSSQLLRRRGFDEALVQVRDGKPAVEVARRCALPLAEVELLQRIHRQTATH